MQKDANVFFTDTGYRCRSYHRGWTLMVPLKILSLKRFTAAAFAVLFRILSVKNMPGDNVLCQNCFKDKEEIQANPTKKDLGTSYE